MDTIIQKSSLRKVHYVGTSVVVTLDPKIVKALGIDDMTFFLQEPIEGGIVMKIRKFESGRDDGN